MPAINFPASPSINDTFTSSGKTWKWNGTFWELVVSGASVADGSVSTAKIADGAITAAKIADGTIVAAEIANNAITTDKIATGAVTAAKLGNDIQLTPPDGSITQAKLAASLSGITVTTTANRGTAVPSPFTGQTIFLTDVTRMQVWNGSAWTFITNGAPGAPTSLSATPLSTTSVSVAFTTGTINGAAVTNYKYAYSSNGGSTYSEFAAFDPVDTTSPVVISGLTGSTAYLIKLRAVSDFGDSPDSSAVAVTTLTAPSPPTSLTATGYYLMARIAFTPGADGGSPITNYEYALSTNSGATYGAFTALSPADTTSPIDIIGLANNTTYFVKLRAVNANGIGNESSAVSVTTNQNIDVEYLVVAGGGGGGGSSGDAVAGGSGGGSGGLVEGSTAASISAYSVTIGGGGAGGGQGGVGAKGQDTSIGLITAFGGGAGRDADDANVSISNGGSGGGASGSSGGAAGSSTQTSPSGGIGYGNAGGTKNDGAAGSFAGGGGGGANSAGSGRTAGSGRSNSLSGSAVIYAVGGTGQGTANFVNAGVAGTANRGNGGNGAANGSASGGAGGSGIVILRYADRYTITLGAGLTGSTTTVGSNKVTTITAGSGNVSWS